MRPSLRATSGPTARSPSGPRRSRPGGEDVDQQPERAPGPRMPERATGRTGWDAEGQARGQGPPPAAAQTAAPEAPMGTRSSPEADLPAQRCRLGSPAEEPVGADVDRPGRRTARCAASRRAGRPASSTTTSGVSGPGPARRRSAPRPRPARRCRRRPRPPTGRRAASRFRSTTGGLLEPDDVGQDVPGSGGSSLSEAVRANARPASSATAGASMSRS